MARAKAIWTRMDEATINTRASIALNTSHGIGTGNKRYRRQMPVRDRLRVAEIQMDREQEVPYPSVQYRMRRHEARLRSRSPDQEWPVSSIKTSSREGRRN